MPQHLDQRRLQSFVPEWAWTALVMLWLVVPILARVGPTVPTALGAGLPSVVAGVLVALLVLWKLASWFFVDSLGIVADPERPLSMVMHVVSSAAVLLIISAHAMTYATRPGYFAAIPWWTWLTGLVSLVWNAHSLMKLIKVLSERDAGFREYAEFRRTTEETEPKGLGRARGIQGRMTMAFTGLILLVVIVLATSLLQDFGTTLLRAIMDNGRALADRTASIVKTSIGDRIALDEYLAIESKKNENSSFPFSSVSSYRRDPKTGSYAIRSSTDPTRIGELLDPTQAAAVKLSESMIMGAKTIEFRAPVLLSGVNLGFTSVVYDRQTIYGPYYLTKVKATIIALLFVYASVFATFLFGRGIVFPILFLSMSVNSLAARLASMVKGDERITSDNLQYTDRVTTKDEIKRLSVEIGNMATVIRGVVPYISASTLKHSARNAPMTELRELAFLFTDIRGFTTICEGLSPENVVSMLNHYLDLQTSAIIANGGDVDKFVGDEIMASFDGPDKEIRACRAGMDIRKAMAEAQAKARSESGAIISIGIGINSGPVVFGSVGARDRMDFTSIGDTVNLAARLEGANKTYGTKSLITEAVYEQVKDMFLCREIDLMTVKGKRVPVRIFELLQQKEDAPVRVRHVKDGFEAGLKAYRAMRWEAARKLFSGVRDTYDDEASAVFLRRVEVFERNPPPDDWDGVFNMTVK
ncbi:MAG TPA: adenylate/guanylate cyclase domain-containing protein [bacterium]|nr:adenylate/guanylate cyclase domain-containing protein [bacterium]